MPKNFAYWIFLVLIFSTMALVLVVGTHYLLQENIKMFESALVTLGMLAILAPIGGFILYRR